LDIRTYQVTPFMMNCYIVLDGDEALVIDPGEFTPRMEQDLAGKRVRAVVNTHGHCDHCGGNAAARRHTGAELLIHADDVPLLTHLEEQGAMFGIAVAASPPPDRTLAEGDSVAVGSVAFEVRHAPGHSPGHVVLVGGGAVFAGDVLFAGSVGRTDLPGGDAATLMQSIQHKLLTLPDEAVVYPGHGPATTIGAERRQNPFLAAL
jgi:glyoxylase-like metal-dependent hydrolase (beta-lactamase superfamily II)